MERRKEESGDGARRTYALRVSTAMNIAISTVVPDIGMVMRFTSLGYDLQSYLSMERILESSSDAVEHHLTCCIGTLAHGRQCRADERTARVKRSDVGPQAICDRRTWLSVHYISHFRLS